MTLEFTEIKVLTKCKKILLFSQGLKILKFLVYFSFDLEMDSLNTTNLFYFLEFKAQHYVLYGSIIYAFIQTIYETPCSENHILFCILIQPCCI